MSCPDNGKGNTKKKESGLGILEVFEALYSLVEAREQLALHKLGGVALGSKRNA
jgi:hypothetical protein